MKNRLIFIVCFLLLKTFPGFSQHAPTGFYMVIADKNNCPNMTHTLTGETIYCLPKDPIITESEFEAIGDIIIDKPHKEKRFDLRLSEAGFKTLSTLASKLPDAQVALVIGGHVSGIYESKGQFHKRTMVVRGDINSPDLDWIHDKVVKKQP